MLFIFLTKLISNELKSNDVNFEQFENINSIFVTLLVLKLDRYKVVNLEQFANILFIYLTLDV